MLLKLDHLSIGKRDADCYDVYHKPNMSPPAPGEKKVGTHRVAALRADFTTPDPTKPYERVATPGTWRIRWEHKYEGEDRFPNDIPKEIEGLSFQTVHDAFAFYCSQVLV
jgi:hypothetical protein